MILILGGTHEAHKLAVALQILGERFEVSLSGATDDAPERSYATRVGGFGGVEGLVEYLEKKEVSKIVDATHPFATQMSEHAITASKRAGVALLRLERPVWEKPEGAVCIDVASLDEAATILPVGARAFLSVGSNSLAPFVARDDVWFLYRVIKPAPLPRPAGLELLQRPPFNIEGERLLLQQHDITHLVTKNSGGDATRAKIDAAAVLGIPAIVIGRPDLPLIDSAATVSDALRWIDGI